MITNDMMLRAREILMLAHTHSETPIGLALQVLRAADDQWKAEGNEGRDSRCWYCCSGEGHSERDHQQSVNRFERWPKS